jgi:tetratricopeptide (TPR) repeat protein
MRIGELDDAQHCLALSQALHDTPPVRTALEQLARRRQEQQRLEELAKQRSREQDLRRRKARLHDQIQEAIAEGKWHKAQADLRRLMKLDPGNHGLTGLKKALDEAVAVRIRQLLDKGNALYRKGRIQEAKTAWEAVLALDPKQQQAQANVKRAERVLNKLRELKQQAPKTAPPPTREPAS